MPVSAAILTKELADVYGDQHKGKGRICQQSKGTKEIMQREGFCCNPLRHRGLS